MKHLFRILGLVLLSHVVVSAQTVKSLTPLTSFGSFANGQIEPPNDNPPLDTLTNQRGLAVDPVTGKLVLVDSHSGSAGSNVVQGSIFVLDGDTGLTNSTLSTNGISGGNYADSCVAIADDGVVYVCNQVNNSTVSTNPFTIYRWASVNSTDAPTIAFSGTLTPAQRYGADMDVRGSGTGTQIIIGSKVNTTTGTNVVIFTTSNGTTFTPTVLSTDTTIASFDDGIAFGSGNTFWAKKNGAQLRLMSFNLATASATTLNVYDLPGGLTHGPIAVDTANNRLAAIDIATGTTGSERVFLYDIADTGNPKLLDVKSFNRNNANSTAPPGFLDFRLDRLYAHVVNNGLAAFTIDDISTPFPTILTQPVASTRLVAGQTVTLSVLAYPIQSYQWQKNGTNIPNATNAVLKIVNAQATDSGTYHVIVHNSAGDLQSSDSEVSVLGANDLYHFNTLWTTAPSAGNYVTSTGGGGTPNERNIAYNSLSNHLYVVQKVQGVTAWNVNVLDASTGVKLYNLKTNGIFMNVPALGGTTGIGLDGIGVADDGAIYACNMTGDAGGFTNANGVLRIYRWENGNSNTVPIQIFTGEPMAGAGVNAAYRWGDVMAVRGSGMNTQILLDNQNNTNHYAAILVPTDSTMTNWTSRQMLMENGLTWGTTIGRSLQFGDGNTFYQKRRNAHLLRSTGFDPDSALSVPTQTSASSAFSSTTAGVFVNPAYNVAVGLNLAADGANSSPDSVDLYDASDLTAPIKIASYNFPQNHINNGNFIGWAVWSGNKAFAIAGNNGLMAFEMVSGPPGPPVFLTQPQNARSVVGSSVSLNVVLDSTATIKWQKNGVDLPGATNLALTLNNVTTNDSAGYRCIATNTYGAATSLVATVTVERAEDNYSLTQVFSVAPQSVSYATTNGGSNSPFERTIAYNSLSNQLLVVQCPVSAATNPTPSFSVYVLDASNGAQLYTLKTDGVGPIGLSEVSGSNPINLAAIGVAADGAVYACSSTPNASGGATADDAKKFKVYRWANTHPDTIPTVVFAGDPCNQSANYRWGDALAVRGSGLNTEILLDSHDGALAAILRPTDGSLTTFTNQPMNNFGGAGSIGRSLQFDSGNVFWQKRKGTTLSKSAFTGAAVSLITNYATFPTTLGPVAVDAARNLVIGIDYSGSATAPDNVALYDVSNFGLPLLVAKYAFAVNQKANANFIGQVVISGNKVFALNANNGIVAFNLVTPPNLQPATLSSSRSGNNLTLSWTDSSYILQSTTSLTPPVSWSNLTSVGQTNSVQSMTGPAKFFRLSK